MIALTTSYDICAAHKLWNKAWDETKNRAAFGHCADLHGHQYKLEVTLTGEISPDTGMLLNGHEIDRIIRDKILTRMDHKYLNDDIPFFKEHQPTAEWIAVWVFEELKGAFQVNCRLVRIRVYETPSLYAEYAG
ncbi:MAG: 6-carboxytetrahydropterin synthase [Deltaproteobacteria bacterium]|nr:6-carboxytetrahydropterin synthase [Deltaproteobacteria bacterium]